MRDPATGADVSLHQASVLDHLDEVGPVSMTGLADHMGVTVATCRWRSIGWSDGATSGAIAIRRTAAASCCASRRPACACARRSRCSIPWRVEQALAQLSPADREAALNGLNLLARASDKHMRSGKAERGEAS